MRARAATCIASVAFAIAAAGLLPVSPSGTDWGLGLAPAIARAQDDLSFRVVSGTVIDDNSAPVAGATVFLKNLKTKSIRSFTSIGDGTFQFAQCNMSVDYELWAEKGAKKSAVKTVSTWDTRKQWVANLKLK